MSNPLRPFNEANLPKFLTQEEYDSLKSTAKRYGWNLEIRGEKVFLKNHYSDVIISGDIGKNHVSADLPDMNIYSWAPKKGKFVSELERLMIVYDKAKGQDLKFLKDMETLEKQYGRRWKFVKRRTGNFYKLQNKDGDVVEIEKTPGGVKITSQFKDSPNKEEVSSFSSFLKTIVTILK